MAGESYRYGGYREFGDELFNAKGTAELDAVVAEIQAINDARNKVIVGDQSSGRQREMSRSQVGAQPGGAAEAPQAARR